ncbi:sialate O-acetylesterase [Haliscomenobacter sp.]|uniref:sialate O-acetylesterase n=1 Tax=Haliscomenobacter sp. TaxID=2717303 RepID=UPI003593E602
MSQQAIKYFSTLCLLVLAQLSWAVSLPAIFSDNMVLQQNSELIIWGWGKPMEKISINTPWNGNTLNTEATNQGLWSVFVKTPKGSMTPYNLTIKGYNEIVLKNVLFGEVWLCSGQSNMEWSANMGINSAQDEVKQANYPNIRFFSVIHRTATTLQIDLEGQWAECSPASMQNFSAVAYFFARKLQADLKVPIGMINSSWGGTPAECWMPSDAFDDNDLISTAAKKLEPVRWGPTEIARIYNAMIEPITKFKIAGALWYQGESNVTTAYAYKETMTALITSWRKKWGQDFPFYYCQIAPYRYGNPAEGAALRDAQRRTLSVPNTGMVVTSDIGDTSDIHPRNKLDVGLRLANLALVKHYKASNAIVAGPLYLNSRARAGQMLVYFSNAEGLNFKGDKITHFELAGEDGVFHPAEAKINQENIVEVQSEMVTRPTMVRYAWGNTATPNLFNGAGLPASCFSSK